MSLSNSRNTQYKCFDYWFKKNKNYKLSLWLLNAEIKLFGISSPNALVYLGHQQPWHNQNIKG